MKIKNFFQINNWGVQKFCGVILAIQLALLGSIALDEIGLKFPILRQIIGFIYLAFIPGIVGMRIFKLHKIDIVEMFSYTIGLSIAILLFTGLFMNTFYPLIGISEPISLMPLIITISGIVLILCATIYLRDKDHSESPLIESKDVPVVPVLFLTLVPFLSIFGTYLMNYYNNNIILILLIFLVSVIVVLIGFNQFIPNRLYPLTVFVISISLLYHTSLISMYISGWDIQLEYYLANNVIKSMSWDPTIYSTVNGMLSIVLLAPIYSNVCDISLKWVFKIVYPFLFSFVPLTLYRIFQKQTSNKIAFLSIFFFMSFFAFYLALIELARQQIAEIFFVLIVLLIIDKNMYQIKKSILFIIFSFSLIISHYGLSYIFMISLVIVWVLLYLVQYKNKNTIKNISLTFILLYVVFAISWYMYVTKSSAFNVVVLLGKQILSSFITDFLKPETSQGMNYVIMKTVSPLHEINKYLHLSAQLSIVVGIFASWFKLIKIKFKKEYIFFSLVNLMILFAAIAVPFFSSSLNTIRLYHIALIILSPYCIVGAIIIYNIPRNIFHQSWNIQYNRNVLPAISIFLAIFLLFNSGLVFEVAKDNPGSFSLNSSLDGPHFNEQEFSGAKWLYEVKNNNVIYADLYRTLLLDSFDWKSCENIQMDISEIPDESYIYFGSLNTVENKITILKKEGSSSMLEYISSEAVINNQNKIYANGNSEVHK
ncbi:putative membrane protein [Methanohalophilus euhalobius]|uniref:Putative membrane protein n=1 Tax=Methanohalophilus euhalobius TaxID=51203 RepID=A0A285GAP4_9EURY|nr:MULTISPECIES: DUF2206 domain-containing protein [Methanohalophilus]ODV48848.1 MAG: hypothetical protein A8273_1860 [Methanohalophilus sp. 2-GBenrich]TCL11597.1 putative membrane protein [Methanohalophilus euhalobius]SNY20650.1 Uncharacterized membrane protein [Methanohalophilus euhalobius]